MWTSVRRARVTQRGCEGKWGVAKVLRWSPNQDYRVNLNGSIIERIVSTVLLQSSMHGSNLARIMYYIIFFVFSRISTNFFNTDKLRSSGKLRIYLLLLYPDLGRFWSAHQRRMDTWPSNTPANTAAQSEKNRKGKAFLPCPLLEGGALTSATLREDEQGRFEWVTAQGRSSSTSERCWKAFRSH